MCISWSNAFWGADIKVQRHLLRSNIELWSSRNRDLKFGMHVYLIKLHILKDYISRSRPPFKVKGEMSIAFRVRDFIFGMHMYNDASNFEGWIVKLQGQSSNGHNGQMDITVQCWTSRVESQYLSMHMYLIKEHILRDGMSRSRSPSKVRGQIHRSIGHNFWTGLSY